MAIFLLLSLLKGFQYKNSLQMRFRDGANFDVVAAVRELVAKYGTEESPSTGAVETRSKAKKRKSSSDGGAALTSKKSRKVRNTDIVKVEGNRAAAEAIREMAEIYRKNKDLRKGSTGDILLYN